MCSWFLLCGSFDHKSRSIIVCIISSTFLLLIVSCVRFIRILCWITTLYFNRVKVSPLTQVKNMDARKEGKQEVTYSDWDDNQDQQPGARETNDGPVWAKEEVDHYWDWDYANLQDLEPGVCNENDGPIDVKEEVENCDTNQDQKPCPLENNDDGSGWVKEEVENWDWDNNANQDQEPGECEENDGPIDVKEDVKNGGVNEDQQPGPAEQNEDGPAWVNTEDYYKDLLRQKEALDPRQFPDIIKLTERELLTSCSSKSSEEVSKHVHPSLDLLNDDSWTRLTVKCFLPRNCFGKFEFARRSLLGPKGAYFKALMAETGSEMSLRGFYVEQRLRDGGDPKYSDLNEETHVLITVHAQASEVYSKLGYATRCLKRHVLWRDGEDLTMPPPWIDRVIQKGEGPSRYYKSQTSNDKYLRYTHARDPTRPLREVFNSENVAPGTVRKSKVFGSAGAGSDYRLLSKASQRCSSDKSVRYHPYQKK